MPAKAFDSLSISFIKMPRYANRIGGGVYRWNGTTYQLPINDVAGLNNSLHGQLWNRTMEVTGTAADEFGANVTLSYEFNVPGQPSTNGEGCALVFGLINATACVLYSL